MVEGMVPGKPAAECGALFIGDRISSVNGKSTRGLAHDSIVQLLKSAGPSLELMVLSAHRRSSGRAPSGSQAAARQRPATVGGAAAAATASMTTSPSARPTQTPRDPQTPPAVGSVGGSPAQRDTAVTVQDSPGVASGDANANSNQQGGGLPPPEGHPPSTSPPPATTADSVTSAANTTAPTEPSAQGAPPQRPPQQERASDGKPEPAIQRETPVAARSAASSRTRQPRQSFGTQPYAGIEAVQSSAPHADDALFAMY